MELRIFLLLLFLWLVPKWTSAQEQRDTTKTRITIENADNVKGKKIDGEFVRYLNGNVRLFQDSMFMYCDTAVIDQNYLVAYGNVVIIQNDTIKIFADSLSYNSSTMEAQLFHNIVLENGEQKLYTDTLVYDAKNKIANYQSGASLISSESQLKSKKGTYFVDSNLVMFYEQVSVQDSAFNLWADSLLYDTKSQTTIFKGPTRIDQKKAKIYCESGFFNMENETAVFSKNAQYIQGEKVAIADTLFYDGYTNLFEMQGNAYYYEPKKEAKGDLIRYNEETEETEIVGHAYYRDENNEIESSSIRYEPETGKFESEGRTSLKDGEMILTADDVQFNEETGIGQAVDHVEWLDTSSNTSIVCDSLDFIKENDFVKAMGDSIQPLLITEMDGDSLFMSADTLISIRQVVDGDTISVLKAYHRVRIFKSNLQAICDSLIYNTSDSLMTLYGSPFIWSDTTQFSGDTIHLAIKNGQIHQIRIPSNGFIINELDSLIYNQIKGREIIGTLKNGNVDSLTVTGNAESLYFLQDELGAYIGLNKTICSKILFEFNKKQIAHIRFYSKPVSELTPMQQVRLSTARLEKFNWNIKERPGSEIGLRMRYSDLAVASKKLDVTLPDVDKME